MSQQIRMLILVWSSFILPKTLPVHSFSNLKVILNSMQFSFLHFKFKINACFSYHHDKLPPFQSSGNHLLAQHLLAVAAIVNSGPDIPLKEIVSLTRGRTAGPAALLSQRRCCWVGIRAGRTRGSAHLDKAPAIRTVPSPGKAALAASLTRLWKQAQASSLYVSS